ncbi:MAG: shikimate kinase [Alphaproteobacteria bacterium]
MMASERKKQKKWRLKKWVVLVGLPGCGKSTLGMSLAKLIDTPFYDADIEISKASNMKVAEIFTQYGEEEFRRIEERVIARLLEEKPAILALGGGAFENENTRKLIMDNAFSVWLKVDHDTILKRVSMRKGRPMFDNTDNPKKLLSELAQKREPNFAKANIQFIPAEVPLIKVAKALNNVLRRFSLFWRT